MSHIVMTGGASGIGAAAAKTLIENGHELTILDIKKPEDLACTYIACDLSDPVAIKEAVNQIKTEISALVNVAGVASGTAGSHKTVQINLLALREITELLWEQFSDGGTVVNIASIAGNNWRKRRPFIEELLKTKTYAEGLNWWQENENQVGTDAYTFSKEAVVLYTMQMAEKGLARNITVNDIGPGPVKTPLWDDFRRDAGEEAMDQMVAMVGRPAQPEDIAEAVVMLAERRLGWLNGHHLVMDGGMTAGFSAGWKR